MSSEVDCRSLPATADAAERSRLPTKKAGPRTRPRFTCIMLSRGSSETPPASVQPRQHLAQQGARHVAELQPVGARAHHGSANRAVAQTIVHVLRVACVLRAND